MVPEPARAARAALAAPTSRAAVQSPARAGAAARCQLTRQAPAGSTASLLRWHLGSVGSACAIIAGDACFAGQKTQRAEPRSTRLARQESNLSNMASVLCSWIETCDNNPLGLREARSA